MCCHKPTLLPNYLPWLPCESCSCYNNAHIHSNINAHMWGGGAVPRGSDGKESACNTEDLGWITGSGPWVRKTPWRRECNPLQYSGLENSTDRGAWWTQSKGLQRVRHNWTTNSLFYFFFSFSICVYINLHFFSLTDASFSSVPWEKKQPGY